MQELGIAITITAGTAMRATLKAVYDIAVKLRDEGPLAEAAFIDAFKRHPLGDLHTFAGFDRIRACEDAFLPAEQLDKYRDSIGHQPDAKPRDK
jgi:2-methylisocitrate lyase-like PEP mutase family enzyme